MGDRRECPSSTVPTLTPSPSRAGRDGHKAGGSRPGHGGGWSGAALPSAPTWPFLQNIVFLGDFNADCSYVKQSDWASIRLRSSDVFKWLIPDSADTTVGKSDCAYDRWVLPWLCAKGPRRGSGEVGAVPTICCSLAGLWCVEPG